MVKSVAIDAMNGVIIKSFSISDEQVGLVLL